MGEFTPYPEELPDIEMLPNVVAHESLVTAEGENMIRGYIRDICATLGDYPQGSCDSVGSRIGQTINWNGYQKLPYNLRYVGKLGCEYSTIQSAINSITDAAEAKQYVVYIFPGTYAEQITPKEWVHLIGLNPNPQSASAQHAKGVMINPTSGSPVLVASGAHITFSNIHFRNTASHIINKASGYSATTTLHFFNCSFYLYNGSYYVAEPSMTNNFIFYGCNLSGNGSTRYVFYFSTTSNIYFNVKLINCYVYGHIRAAAGTQGGLFLSVKNSYIVGKVLSTGGSNIIRLIFSKIAPANGDAICLTAELETEVHMGYSNLYGGIGGVALKKSGGSDTISLYAHHSILGSVLGDGIENCYPEGLNLFNFFVGTDYSPI